MALSPLVHLRQDYPYPDRRPDLPEDLQGWCQPEHRQMVARYIDPHSTQLIVELWSWLGASTRLLLELAPHATVVCVDTWAGSPDINNKPEYAAKIPTLFDTFVVNQWRWRDRVIPMRMDSREGLRIIARYEIAPELIYFDTNHATEHVLSELELAWSLFPKARLYGDDWGWESVRAAVIPFAAKHGLMIVARGNAWALED